MGLVYIPSTMHEDFMGGIHLSAIGDTDKAEPHKVHDIRHFKASMLPHGSASTISTTGNLATSLKCSPNHIELCENLPLNQLGLSGVLYREVPLYYSFKMTSRLTHVYSAMTLFEQVCSH